MKRIVCFHSDVDFDVTTHLGPGGVLSGRFEHAASLLLHAAADTLAENVVDVDVAHLLGVGWVGLWCVSGWGCGE